MRASEYLFLIIVAGLIAVLGATWIGNMLHASLIHSAIALSNATSAQ